MKGNLLAILLIFFFGKLSSQVFWTEDFGTACLPRANVANNYSGINGAWTIAYTSQNEEYGNEWYINDRIAFVNEETCAQGTTKGCIDGASGGQANNSLHLG